MGSYFNEDFWDCECEENYIHPKTEKTCKVCGADQEDQPDSISHEVRKYYKKQTAG